MYQQEDNTDDAENYQECAKQALENKGQHRQIIRSICPLAAFRNISLSLVIYYYQQRKVMSRKYCIMLNIIKEIPEYIVPPLPAASADGRLDLELIDPSHPERATAEAFVKAVFKDAYDARLTCFYPLLMSIIWPDSRYAAIAGVRPAGAEKLFSEHYLDAPIEALLGEQREKIVEIGNLAPASAGQARWLICTLNAFMSGAGFTHVVFTAVPRLYNAFRRMGLPLLKHADARPECLSAAEVREWGSYYNSKPAVYSGDIRIGERAFRKLTATAPELQDISRRAFKAGRAFANQGPADERNYTIA